MLLSARKTALFYHLIDSILPQRNRKNKTEFADRVNKLLGVEKHGHRRVSRYSLEAAVRPFPKGISPA